MHAFLVIGNQINKINKKVSEISSNLAAKPYNFKLEKIEDTRELRKLVKLSLETPRVYIIKDIDKATNEATNAFLKSLEEPHKNTYFILTAQSLFNVIGTISSRCQLIFTTINNELTPQEETQISNFLKGTISDKFSQIDSIRKREEAIAFTSLLIKAFYKLINFTGKTFLYTPAIMNESDS